MKVLKYSNFLKESYKGDLELEYYCFDWDDNILHMPTVIHMDKLTDGNWVPTDVSTSEFAKIRNDKENYRLVDNNPDLAFSEFRDSGNRGDKAFLEDVKKALNEGQFGPSWDKFIKCLREGAIFSIITARGHEPITMRKAVEYIIDEVISEEDRFELYNNCLKHSYLFNNDSDYERIPKGKISNTDLIDKYLSTCEYYGVSSNSFANEFGKASASNPEHAKQLALEKFIEKCNLFGHNIGAKSVSIGFSDDDPKNVDHVRKYFKEKSALSNVFKHDLHLSLHKTTDRNIKGGEITKFKKGEERLKESNISTQSPGMASSIMPFSSFNNQASRLFPSTGNDPVANTHKMATNYISKKTDEWTKDSIGKKCNCKRKNCNCKNCTCKKRNKI